MNFILLLILIILSLRHTMNINSRLKLYSYHDVGNTSSQIQSRPYSRCGLFFGLSAKGYHYKKVDLPTWNRTHHETRVYSMPQFLK